MTNLQRKLYRIKYANKHLSNAEVAKLFGDKYNVHVVFDREHPLALFKYTIKTSMSSKWAKECRGTILDLNDFSSVSRPYDKFWNFNDGKDTIDFSEPFSVTTKFDGTCICMFHNKYALDNGRFGWQVQTLGDIRAEGVPDEKDGRTFSELFWGLFEDTCYFFADTTLKDLSSAFSDTTFIFELCTPHNKIVVDYDYSFIVSHGARMRSGEEVSDTAICLAASIPPASKTHVGNVESEQDLLNLLNSTPGYKNEGFVVTQVQNGEIVRVKYKSADYRALHQGFEATEDKLLDLHLDGLIFHNNKAYDSLLKKLKSLELEADALYASVEHLTRSMVGLSVKGSKFKSYIFFRMDGKGSFLDWLKKLSKSSRKKVLA